MTEAMDLDESALTRLSGIGGEAFLGQMIDIFLCHVPDRIESAWKAHREENRHAIAGAMHSLKSSAGNLGACQMQKLAESIEQLAAAGDRNWIESRLTDLQVAFGRAERLLRARKETLGR